MKMKEMPRKNLIRRSLFFLVICLVIAFFLIMILLGQMPAKKIHCNISVKAERVRFVINENADIMEYVDLDSITAVGVIQAEFKGIKNVILNPAAVREGKTEKNYNLDMLILKAKKDQTYSNEINVDKTNITRMKVIQGDEIVFEADDNRLCLNIFRDNTGKIDIVLGDSSNVRFNGFDAVADSMYDPFNEKEILLVSKFPTGLASSRQDIDMSIDVIMSDMCFYSSDKISIINMSDNGLDVSKLDFYDFRVSEESGESDYKFYIKGGIISFMNHRGSTDTITSYRTDEISPLIIDPKSKLYISEMYLNKNGFIYLNIICENGLYKFKNGDSVNTINPSMLSFLIKGKLELFVFSVFAYWIILMLLIIGIWRTKPDFIILFAYENSQTNTLDIKSEIKILEDIVELSGFKYEFKPVSQLQIDKLIRYIDKYEPQIVHIATHGGYSEERIDSTLSTEGAKALDFVSSDGEIYKIGVKEFANLFRSLKYRPRCLVLNTCYSNDHAQVSVHYFDYVVSMNNEIYDSTSIKFTEHFYKALLIDKRSVADSFSKAIDNLRAEGNSDSSYPQLYPTN